ncbi:hypothetical protein C8Q80DRAFT_1115040 [Daedaleopsis nitida]|nr:hypothetical protein C8Q80DRAFT_1115040 [Daedaleopsis nitida]
MGRGAVALKEQGNELFRAGILLRASEMYTEAEKADASDPMYPSNLSAALFELGDYKGCAEAVLRAWSHIRGAETQTGPLVVRLSTRLAKALCNGVHAATIQVEDLETLKIDADEMRSAALNHVADDASRETVRQAWAEWSITRSDMSDRLGKRDSSLVGLSRLAIFSKPLDYTKEFYAIGHDHIIDLTKGWGQDYPQPLHLDKFSAGDLQNIAFLFGGVGDARHVFGSLLGLSAAHKTMGAKGQADFHAHLTLLDIHDATIARDLCIFMLLHQLNGTNDETVRTEIKVTLMYVFCGAVMPSYCYQRLQDVFKDLSVRLASRSPVLPRWMHVSPDSAAKVVTALAFWLSASRSTRATLAHHNVTECRGLPPAGHQSFLNDAVNASRASLKADLLSMTGAELVQVGLAPAGTPAKAARAMVRKDIDQLVEELVEVGMQPEDHHVQERAFYVVTKVFLPPEELRHRHPYFEVAWGQVCDHGEMRPSVMKKIVNHIESSWKPNVTLIDASFDNPECSLHRDGYRDLREDMFESVIDEIESFNALHATVGSVVDKEMLAWDVCNVFFEGVAAALKNLEGKVILEFLIGDLCGELSKMRCGDYGTRPRQFPSEYTRMWLSNVPDYTHGPMNVIVYVAPSLQDHPYAAVACNSLLNTSAWKDDQEFFHTYTLLKIEDVSRYLGCTIINSCAVMEIFLLGPSPSLPRPLSELATREELTTWLSRVLFHAFIHGRSVPCYHHDTRLPHNLVAFFGLLMYLHRIGYPPHWLSAFLARVLSGRMVADVIPYTGTYPIPICEYERRVPARTVRTDPWLVEFETIIATAYYAIPFPIASALPADFSRDAEDMVVWEVQVEPTQWAHEPETRFYGTPYHPVTHLLFYRFDELDAEEVIGDMLDIFEGCSSPACGTFFVLTSQEHVMYLKEIRFWLSKKRVERMRKEKWAMVAYRNDVGIQATHPVPISSWVQKEKESAEHTPGQVAAE